RPPYRPERVGEGGRMRRSGPFLIAMVVWFALACAAGVSGRVAALTPPLPQIVIAAITLALVLAGALLPGLRAWLAQVNLRGFVAFHVTRFVGIAFLVMSARGELSREWALPAGWGDIVTATGALLISLFLGAPESRPGLLRAWNWFGFLDILMVVITAARPGMRDPASMAPLFRFPMSLVPTFLVPLIIASHALVAERLWWRRRAAGAAGRGAAWARGLLRLRALLRQPAGLRHLRQDELFRLVLDRGRVDLVGHVRHPRPDELAAVGRGP